MTSRRKFMQSAIATAALTASPLAARAVSVAEPTAARAGSGSVRRHRPFIVFARESAAGVDFGAEAGRRGAPALAFRDDIGGIWMHVLEPRLRAAPVAIAGLSGGAQLFCLEYLARAYELCVVYRIEHARLANGSYRHNVTGPARAAHWAQSLAAAGDDWAAVAARLATACPADLLPDPTLALPDLAQLERSRALFTWLLAPRMSTSQGRSPDLRSHNRARTI
jgi:hypothetical protein